MTNFIQASNIMAPAVFLIQQYKLCIQDKGNLQNTNKEKGMSEMSDDGYATT